MRAYRRDADGDIDECLVPKAILAWYVDTEDEQDTLLNPIVIVSRNELF